MTFVFYWISWLFWGVITFFMEKSPLRTFFACLILSSILCSNLYFTVGRYQVLISFVLLITMAGFLYTSHSKSLYQFFCTFTLMIGYTAILLWKQSTSLSLLVPDFFLVPLIFNLLVFLMIKGLSNRLAISILGIASGEVLHGLILASYHLPVVIGDLNFFVNLYMIILYQLILNIFQKRKDHSFIFVNP